MYTWVLSFKWFVGISFTILYSCTETVGYWQTLFCWPDNNVNVWLLDQKMTAFWAETRLISKLFKKCNVQKSGWWKVLFSKKSKGEKVPMFCAILSPCADSFGVIKSNSVRPVVAVTNWQACLRAEQLNKLRDNEGSQWDLLLSPYEKFWPVLTWMRKKAQTV